MLLFDCEYVLVGFFETSVTDKGYCWLDVTSQQTWNPPKRRKLIKVTSSGDVTYQQTWNLRQHRYDNLYCIWFGD